MESKSQNHFYLRAKQESRLIHIDFKLVNFSLMDYNKENIAGPEQTPEDVSISPRW